MSREMVKEKAGFIELVRSFFSAEYDEDEVLEDVTSKEKKELKEALNNVDKIMEEASKSGKREKKKYSEPEIKIKNPERNEEKTRGIEKEIDER